ncbi:hypothetical protein PENTCL1PPCAC_9476, partial [Pristionchus entomophagus]
SSVSACGGMIGRLSIQGSRSISSHLGAFNSEIRKKLDEASQTSQIRDNFSVKSGTYTETEWADSRHRDQLLLMAEKFLLHEPQSIALKMGPPETRPLLEHLVSKALHTPFSLMVYDKENGKTLGFRLTTVAHRDGSLDANPVPLKIESPRVITFWNAIEKLQGNFWRMYPGVNTVLRHEIAYVAPCYQRAGIATRMLDFGLDPKTLEKENKFDGIVVESTSEKSHSILAQSGYACKMQLERTEYLDEDGKMLDLQISPHDNLRLYFKSLRTIDDTPYYTRQWS